MTSRDFCFWLQGYFEISGNHTLGEEQCKVVRNHLALVFRHEIDVVDPTGELQKVHDGLKDGGFKPAGAPDQVYRC